MREISKHYIRPIPLPREEQQNENTDAGSEPLQGPALSSYRLKPAYGDAIGFWDATGVAIATAGAVYPMIAVVASILVGAIGMLLTTPQELVYALPQAAPFALGALLIGAVMGVVGFFLTGLASVPVLLSVAFALHLLGWKPKFPGLGAVCGGLVATLCILPFLLSSGWSRQRFSPDLLMAFAVGPMLAICCGLVAGAYAGTASEHQAARRDAGQRQIKFSIKQLFAITLVVSLVLGVLKGLGCLNTRFMVTAGACLGWMGLAYVPAVALGRRMFMRRIKRLTRVTKRMADEQQAVDAEFEQQRLESIQPTSKDEPPGTTG